MVDLEETFVLDSITHAYNLAPSNYYNERHAAGAAEMLLTSPGCMMLPYFIEEVDERVGGLPGVESVELETDGGYEWEPSMMADSAHEKRAERRRELEERYGEAVERNAGRT